MPDLGPAAVILLSFIAAIGSLTGTFLATKVLAGISPEEPRYPSLG